jgi:two-component system, chemotaxis family, CheB/CheR fusion protein
LGQGSEFVIRVPVVPGSAVGTVVRHEVKSRASATHRVLIVDDNADAAESMAMLARTWGHEVVVVGDGPSALKAASDFQPQRALVDIGLPGMDGYEVARRRRAAPEHSNLLLVAMTGYGRDEDREKAYAAGFDVHLVKPGDLDELQDVLANGAALSRRTPPKNTRH